MRMQIELVLFVQSQFGPQVHDSAFLTCCILACACSCSWQVVGFHSGYHAMAIMATGAKLANGKRMGQVAGIRLALRDSVLQPDGEAGQVFMQLDGEPWVQKVPAGSGDTPVVVSGRRRCGYVCSGARGAVDRASAGCALWRLVFCGRGHTCSLSCMTQVWCLSVRCDSGSPV
jgi:hypothetical protein